MTGYDIELSEKRNAAKFPPTSEQEDAIAKFLSGGSLRVNAYAGTGKTSTLELLSYATKGRGVYLAFNKTTATEAASRFSPNVSCKTTHSMAFAWAVRKYGVEKMTGKMYANDAVSLMGIKGVHVLGANIPARSVAALALETVGRFCQSDAENIETYMASVPTIVEPYQEERQIFQELVAGHARAIWAKCVDTKSPAPLGHDGYLKLWSLSHPRIHGDYIFLDEAQDTNPAVISVMRDQTCQIVYTGDRYQQIYEWRGAVNAMERMPADAESRLTMSFRFGEEIADLASATLRMLGEFVPVRGNANVSSSYTTEAIDGADCVLCRSNAGVIEEVFRADKSARPYVVGGVDSLKRLLDGVIDLENGKPSSLREFVGFSNWTEVTKFVEENGGDLAILVSLVAKFGSRRLLDALRSNLASRPEDAAYVISTVHKAKGLEWPTVRISDDMTPRPKCSESFDANVSPSDAEIRLLYVAVTRAKNVLSIPPGVATLFGARE